MSKVWRDYDQDNIYNNHRISQNLVTNDTSEILSSNLPNVKVEKDDATENFAKKARSAQLQRNEKSIDERKCKNFKKFKFK